MSASRFLHLAYVYKFLESFVPMYALYALMFQDVGGLDAGQISVLFMIWVAAAFVFEIPTGIVGDRFSRKYVLILSSLLHIAVFLIWLYEPNFWGYAIGFVVWGLAFAFQSGSQDAYFFEAMQSFNQEATFTKVLGRLQSIGLIGMTGGYLAASFIAPDYTLALYVSVGIALLELIPLTLLPHIHVKKEATTHLALLKDAWQSVKASRILLMIVLVLAFFEGVVGIFEEYVPLVYAWSGASASLVPLMLTIGMLSFALTSWYVARLEDVSTKTLLRAAFLLLGMFMIGLWLGSWYAIITMFLFMLSFRTLLLLFRAHLQHSITSEARATTGSLAMFGGELLGIVFILFFVGLSVWQSDIMAMIGMTTVALIGVLALLMCVRRFKI